MTSVVLLALLGALGVLGIASGLRGTRPSLDAVYAAWQQPSRPPVDPTDLDDAHRWARVLVGRIDSSRWSKRPRVQQLFAALSVVGSSPVSFVTSLVVTVAACALGPLVCWLALQAVGVAPPLGPVILLSVVATAAGLLVPVARLHRRAAARRRHVRAVVASYVDLVVLCLAGGVGVDGALFSASQVSPDWVAQRIARGLLAARDAGVAPWSALAGVGEEFDVSELVELAATVQLAGTEGARIRQALSARGASLRRHEQADVESAANAMTERLFLPGALLLLGFLLFIGYPAVCRVLGGF